MELYSGAWPVIPTPFNDHLQIDTGAYHALIEWYIENGAGGLYANCLTSEMYHLTPEERLLLVRETVKANQTGIPIAATGNFGVSIDEHADFCARVADNGAEVVMLVVPAFIRDDNELHDYLFAMAEKVDARLGLYECPVPRPYHLGIDLVEKLALTGRYYAFKETSCDLAKIRQLIQVTSGTPLAYLQANTPYLLDAVRAGSPGTMSIAAGFAPDLTSRVIDLAQRDDPQADRAHDLLCAMEMAERVVHPVGMKYLLSKRGLPISTRARAVKEPLSAEVLRGLDSCARVWF